VTEVPHTVTVIRNLLFWFKNDTDHIRISMFADSVKQFSYGHIPRGWLSFGADRSLSAVRYPPLRQAQGRLFATCAKDGAPTVS